MKPGKKEKIRYGKAPKRPSPARPKPMYEDAGAVQTGRQYYSGAG